MDTTTAGTMAKRVLVSASAGVLAGAFPLEPINLAFYQHYTIHNDYWTSIGLLEATEISWGGRPASPSSG